MIDGRDGENVDKAIGAYQREMHLQESGHRDIETLKELAAKDADAVLQQYTVSEEDVRGPSLKAVPPTLEDMAKLERLSYSSPEELLSEKFHLDQDLLRALNPGVDFAVAGTEIVVPQVRRGKEGDVVAHIVVDKKKGALSAYNEQGKLIAFYPASVGSEGKPSPTGTHTVRAIAPRPRYYYNPKELSFRGVQAKGLLEIAAGPNNPVGTVWIDLTEPTYGIHGTPEPSLIAKSQSHGCVRLTNWDAEDLSMLVRKGTTVTFR